MSYSFRPAIKSSAKPLIGLYAESGRGKTLSALYLARGFAGDGKIGMIETEAGRGEAYAGVIPGGYDVLPVRESFAPAEYGEAITAAEKAGLTALIIDSGSHEWESVGGVLHMAAQNQQAGKKGPLVWQQPKLDHRRHFIQRLISTPIPLVILCLRARYPMREDKQKREWVRSEELVPMQSEDILFEMFVHGWIDKEHRFHGTKYTLDELRQVVKDNEPISIDSGRRLAEWARGGATSTPPATGAAHAPASPGPTIPALVAEAKRLATKIGLSAADRTAYRTTHCEGKDLHEATADQLTALIADLKKRAGEDVAA